MELKPVISIIVPVYNVPRRYLKKCIESTLAQTMYEIEVVIVDDGSTDGSSAICDKYAEKDRRIVVIHKKNEGLSAARNTGVDAASGEWILFLDGDDWLESDTCEKTYAIAKKNDVDIVMFKAVQEFSNHSKPLHYPYEKDTFFKGEECYALLKDILTFDSNIASAWGKLIKRKLLVDNGIYHDKKLRQGSEGIEFNIRLFQKLNRVFFLDKCFYHYIYNGDSISAKHNEKNHFYVIKCFEKIKQEILLLKDSKLMELFYVRFAHVVVATAVSGYFSPHNLEPFKVKKKKYSIYLSKPLVKETMKSVNRKRLDLKRRIVLCLIELHLFRIIAMLAFVRDKQKH